jgi:glycosyltransferase involved in cell wall biosynthesis
MPHALHLVTTGSFAGVERYVAAVAAETARRGWDVTVVGGDGARMRAALGAEARWLRGDTPARGLAALARAGRADVCNAHMTLAEAVAVVGRPLHRAPVVATRHFAAHRGASRLGGIVAPLLGRRLARQLAVSEYVARTVEAPTDAVVPSGVPGGPLRWRPESRVVLVLQRLEPEKDTATALRAWEGSGLAADGWSLRVVGDGAERPALERLVGERAIAGVELAGWTDDPAAELDRAGIVLSPGARDSFGLTVAEAMVAGVPVVAAAGGGHLETIGLVRDAPLFPPGDAASAAEQLRRLADDAARAALSAAVHAVALERLTLERHVDALLEQYALLGVRSLDA